MNLKSPVSILVVISAGISFFTACSQKAENPSPVTNINAPAAPAAPDMQPPIVWELDNMDKIGGHALEIIGKRPDVLTDDSGEIGPDGSRRSVKGLHFDGMSQGLLMPVFPIAGWTQFTVEAEIYPEAGGEFEQRFFHGGAMGGARAMLELRSNPDGTWYLDAHLRDDAEGLRTLIDEKKTHPSGQWYVVAMTYDGKTMTSYVNGVKEGEGTLVLKPMPAGPVSLGVRQSKEFWFKGAMRDVRFYSDAQNYPAKYLLRYRRIVGADGASAVSRD